MLAAGLFLLLLVAAPRNSASASGNSVFESFDSGSAGWAASRGSLRSSDVDKREGSAALVWQFEYPKDAVFLFTKSGLEKFSGTQGVSLWLKSDRPGPVFLRFDQRDGAPYIVSFPVGNDWQRHSFRFDQFQPAGNSRNLNSSQLTAFYLVDLQGKDAKAKGSRTLWVDGIECLGSDGPAAAQANSRRSGPNEDTQPLAAVFGNRPRQTAAILLKTWDQNGAPLSAERWKEQGTSAGEYLFASDLNGVSVYGKAGSSREGGVDATLLETDGGRPVAVNALFWMVPGFGKLWLRADNQGKGYMGSQVLHLNYELAASRLAALRSSEAGQSTEANRRLGRAQEMVSRAEHLGDETEKARVSNEALTEIVRVAEELELAQARLNIEKFRKGGLTVVVKQGGRVVPGASVRFRETRSDTLMGCIQSFGFLDQKLNQRQMSRVADLMRDAGFNHFTVSLFWDRIEPKPGQYDLDEWDRSLGLDAFNQRGFTFTAHAIVQSALPDHVKKAGAKRFSDLAVKHIDRLMDHYEKKYPERFVIWQAVNEPASNRFVGLSLEEKENMIEAVSRRIHSNAPRAQVMVNDYNWDRGQRHKANFMMPDVREMVSTFEYYTRLNQRRVPFDIMGLQWYPGLRVIYGGGIINLSEPLMDLSMTGEQWDRYASIGKPLHITEMAVPGTSQRDWKNGYWKQPWTPELQAEYMKTVYTLAFSKPYIKEITYWGISDHEPWALAGGMLDKNWQPKPLYETLKTLLHSWMTQGEGRTNGRGELAVRGFAGEYEIEVQAGASRKSVKARVVAREDREMVVEL